ncbi:hypothetical protein BC360_05065 [Ensifer sp. LC163]|nr:hypothetical protein BC360_05065 [Ensifer sp. LC163]
MTLALNEIHSVTATPEQGVYMVTCNITDMHGDRYDCEYYSRPDDDFGLNPTIRQWLADNPSFPIGPYTPPTPEEIRKHMPSLTARQFRLGLVAGGYAPAQVTQAIDTMPDGTAKETAKIEWEYATTFNRMHPLIATVGAALGLNDTQIDAMWLAAVNL